MRIAQPQTGISLHRRKCQRAVVAAEAEAVRQDFTHPNDAGRVRDVIEVAVGVGRVEVDRRGQDAVLEAQATGDGLDAAAGPEQVADHALGARHHQSLRVFAEDFLDGLGLGELSELGAGPIGVIAASVPPLTITSAKPPAICRMASPIAWAADEHAVLTVVLGPWRW